MNRNTFAALLLCVSSLPVGAQSLEPQADAPRTGVVVDTAPSAVVAARGGADVDFLDIDARVARIPAASRAGFMDSPERIESVIQGLLLSEQLANQARELKLDQDPVVQREIELAANEVLARLRMERLNAEIQLPDLDVLAEEKYLTNKAQYAVAGTVTVLHVLIDTKDRSEEDARKLAAQVLQEARDAKADFKDLVDRYSDDPSHETNGGMIQDAGSEKYDPAFAAAARELKTKGELSAQPVKSAYGYHVLKLLEHLPTVQRTFADVKPGIVEELRAGFIEQQRRDFTDKLRNMPLQADPDRVASLRTRYKTPAHSGQSASPTESQQVAATQN